MNWYLLLTAPLVWLIISVVLAAAMPGTITEGTKGPDSISQAGKASSFITAVLYLAAIGIMLAVR